MEIIATRPPNFAAIVKVFPLAMRPTTVFCYGNTIYAPGGRNLAPAILSHESVHARRQVSLGVEKWWDEYLTSADFRLSEEIPAHRAEYVRLSEDANRGMRRAALSQVAKKLAAPLYGNLLSVNEAKRLIGGADAAL